MKNLIILIHIFNILLFGSNTQPNITPQTIYHSTKQQPKNILKFKKQKNTKELNKKFSNIKCKQQTQLNLINYYYKSNNLAKAQQIIHQFLYLYPNNDNIDFIIYMRGIINVSLDKNRNNTLHKLFNINLSQYNPIHAYAALQDFSHLIEMYPASQYYTKANKQILNLNNRIAEFELHIIKFYTKKKAYISVINRVNNLLNTFPNTPASRQALIYKNKAYKALTLNKTKNKIKQISTSN